MREEFSLLWQQRNDEEEKEEEFFLPWQYGWMEERKERARFSHLVLVVVVGGGDGVGEFIKRLIQSRGNNGLPPKRPSERKSDLPNADLRR